MSQRSDQAASAIVFCPQNKPPTAAYLSKLRRYMRSNPTLEPFVEAILDLPETWKIYARTNAGIAALQQGPRYVKHLQDWVTDGNAAPLAEIMSGIITLPILTIIQIVQYFQYLEVRGIGHAQFLEEIRVGGAQGFCGGLLPAAAVAPSRDEQEVVRNAAISLRLALGIGAYGELGDEPDVPGPTTVVLRLKYAGQADEIVAKFPGVSFLSPFFVFIFVVVVLSRQLVAAVLTGGGEQGVYLGRDRSAVY
jgi:hypothetical protein